MTMSSAIEGLLLRSVARACGFLALPHPQAALAAVSTWHSKQLRPRIGPFPSVPQGLPQRDGTPAAPPQNDWPGAAESGYAWFVGRGNA
jgi:hypothetical protein